MLGEVAHVDRGCDLEATTTSPPGLDNLTGPGLPAERSHRGRAHVDHRLAGTDQLPEEATQRLGLLGAERPAVTLEAVPHKLGRIDLDRGRRRELVQRGHELLRHPGVDTLRGAARTRPGSPGC